MWESQGQYLGTHFGQFPARVVESRKCKIFLAPRKMYRGRGNVVFSVWGTLCKGDVGGNLTDLNKTLELHCATN